MSIWGPNEKMLDLSLRSILTRASENEAIQLVNVVDQGAIGNGTSDDTAAIQAAVNLAADMGGAPVYIPAGVYLIDGTVGGAFSDVGGVSLRSGVHLLLHDDAVLKVMETANSHYTGINAVNVQNASISGGAVIGERNGHLGGTGEWGHGIAVFGGSDIRIENVRVEDCWGDGIYVGPTDAANAATRPSRVKIDNVQCHNNRRQGISVCGAVDVTLAHVRCYDTNGTAPEFGIDLEPDNAATPNERVTLIDVVCEGNNGGGLLVTHYNKEVRGTNCRFSVGNGGYSYQSINTLDQVLLTDCDLVGPVLGGYTTLQNCKVVMTSVHGPQYAIITNASNHFRMIGGQVEVSGVAKMLAVTGAATRLLEHIFRNVVFVQEGNAPSSGSNMNSITGNTTLDDCKFIHTGASPVTSYGFAYAAGLMRMRRCYVAPQLAAGVRSGDNVSYDTAPEAVNAPTNRGDVHAVLSAGTSARIQIWSATLTESRIVDLDVLEAYPGATFRIVRTGGGVPWTLNVTGIKNLTQNQWVDVVYDGAAWKLTGFGSL